jgi:hypothetical protein
MSVMGRFVWLMLVLIACDATTTAFDGGANDGGPNDAVVNTLDACFAYCQASGIVAVEVGCGKVADAMASGACTPASDAAPLDCPEDAAAPFVCLAHASTTGTCSVSITFEDGGTFAGTTTITRTPPGCCGNILVASPSTIVVSDCDAGTD